jgi:hypothetical protein
MRSKHHHFIKHRLLPWKRPCGSETVHIIDDLKGSCPLTKKQKLEI